VNNWGYDSTQGHDIDNNAYMGNTAWPFIWGDQVTSDFDTWKTLSLQDAHSLETTTMGLNNPPINFELTNNSPAIDAGIDVGLSWDFAGKPVPQNTFVDIGALESPFSGSEAGDNSGSIGTGGGGGGCFISTATHESDMNPFMESVVIVFSKLLEIKKQQIEFFHYFSSSLLADTL
jgi:hypothetical protein